MWNVIKKANQQKRIVKKHWEVSENKNKQY